MVKEFYLHDAWKQSKLMRILPLHVVNSIKAILFNNDREDRPIWTPDPSGDFTCKSAWRTVRSKKGTTLTGMTIWYKKLPFKVSVFMSRVLLDQVATDVAIKRFGVNIASIHWSKARCSARFDEKHMSHRFIIQQVIKMINMFIHTSFQDLHLPNMWHDTYSKIEKLSLAIHCQIFYWHKPPTGWVKLNIDGCSKGNPGSAGGGGLIRDHNGVLIGAFAEFYGDCSCNIAEAKAMRRGIKMYITNGLTNVIVEYDSAIILNLIKRTRKPPWRFNNNIEQIQTMTKHRNFVFCHTLREGNNSADKLANLGEESKIVSIFNEVVSLPLNVRASMKLEVDGIPNFRFRQKKNKFVINDSTYQ
ncbi:PREDICTED: uncharacterized protein LOC109237833 [Nicotiana attenuata]|uniref:uncharacterized protein LOC109237833 n=1 Tax=Nicotiana attenuata TaxID=49451 RepID=UPI0009051014|nr:PREDICTED: uncharacterized protein LOC109237833 [Nicotiana attenuata]